MDDQLTQSVMLRSFTEMTVDVVTKLPKEKQQIIFNHLTVFLAYLLKLSYKNEDCFELLIRTLEKQRDDINRQKVETTGLLGVFRSKSNVIKAGLSMDELVSFVKINGREFLSQYGRTDKNKKGPTAVEVLFQQISDEVEIDENDQKHIFRYIVIQSNVLGLT